MNDFTSPLCSKCGLPYTYVGDIIGDRTKVICTCSHISWVENPQLTVRECESPVLEGVLYELAELLGKKVVDK